MSQNDLRRIDWPTQLAHLRERYEEAKATGAEVVAVGCPFCMQMFNSAKTEVENGPEVRDIVEIIAERLPDTVAAGD